MERRPQEIEDTKNTLHEQTYAGVREQTSLQASLVQSARNLVADALGNCKGRILDDGKKASKPAFRRSVVVYNGQTITYNDDHVTLATVGDRVTAEFVTPEDDEGTTFAEYWTDDWERKEATLIIKSIGPRFARWSADYLHRVSKAIVREAVENDCTAIAFENLKHIRERISNDSKFSNGRSANSSATLSTRLRSTVSA